MNLIVFGFAEKCKAQEKPGWDKNVRIANLYGGFRSLDCTIVSDVAGCPGGQLGAMVPVNYDMPLELDSSCPSELEFWFLDLRENHPCMPNGL